MWHSRPAKQRVWLGPDRYISGCDRRITHANAYCDSNSYSYSNRYRYIDAKREPNGYSFSHSYTETYTYSETSSVRSSSAHTAASNVAIFTRATFSHSGDG